MSHNLEHDLRKTIIDVPDFPKPGILFKDITPILADAHLRERVTAAFAEHYHGLGVTAIAGMESRGFLFGVPLADALDASFVPIRKPGKLPRTVYRQEYALEYGTDELQVHRDDLTSIDRVVIIDDLLATGGTAEAARRLIQQTGATIVGLAFVIELSELNGRAKIAGDDVVSLVRY